MQPVPVRERILSVLGTQYQLTTTEVAVRARVDREYCRKTLLRLEGEKKVEKQDPPGRAANLVMRFGFTHGFLWRLNGNGCS